MGIEGGLSRNESQREYLIVRDSLGGEGREIVYKK